MFNIQHFNPMLTFPIGNILVEKAKHQMHLRYDESVVKTYRISLGKNPVGAKVKSGDNARPIRLRAAHFAQGDKETTFLTSPIIVRQRSMFSLQFSATARISFSVGFPFPLTDISCSALSRVFVISYAGESL